MQVAVFSSEFLKRKLAEQTGTGKKSRKARAKAAAATPAAQTKEAVISNSAPPTAVEGKNAWEKVPKTAIGKKKGKKATKADPSLLGFGSGTDYSLLETAG